VSPKTTHEFKVRLALTPRLARWLLPVFLCAAFPTAAGTSDQPFMTNYTPSPAGVYSRLAVTGGGQLPAGAALAPLSSSQTSTKVGMGTVSPARQLHVAGNLKVVGCIWLKTTKRCSWDPE